MNFNRRDFLKKSGLATLGLTGLGSLGSGKDNEPYQFKNRQQAFNMHNYAAPAIDLVRILTRAVRMHGKSCVKEMTLIWL